MQLTKNFESFFKYYIYRHIRLDTLTPFYIGAGTKPNKFNTFTEEYRRAFKKCDRDNHWKRVVGKCGYVVEIIFESNNLSFIKEKEKEFISLYGRKNNNTGILINKTDGGDGATGRVYVPSKETIDKIAEKTRGRKLSKEHTDKLHQGRRNSVTSEESRIRYRECKLGTKHSDQHRAKNSLAKKGGNHPKAKKIIHIKSGVSFDCIMDATDYFGLDYTTFIKYLNGKIKSRNYAAHKEFQFI